MTTEYKCTCPCIDCIEGNHCGGSYFWPDENGEDQLIGECYYPTDDQDHAMGLKVDGCSCQRCQPDLYYSYQDYLDDCKEQENEEATQ